MNNILSKDIVREWGLHSLSEEKQMEMVDRIGRLLYQALLVRSLDILAESEQVELKRSWMKTHDSGRMS